PPRLRAGQVLRDHAARCEDDRVLLIHLLGGRRVAGHVEPRLAIREEERAGALRYGVPRARLEQARRAGVVLVVARPEDAELPLDLLVGDAPVVDHAAARGSAQLVEDLARAAERE